MSNTDDFKKAAKEALDTIVDVSVEAYKAAEEKAKLVARWTKLNTEITVEKSHVRRLRSEIGEIYYMKFKDAPDTELSGRCRDITTALDRIDAKRRELEYLKKNGVVSDEDFSEDKIEYDEESDNSEDTE